jgi:hydrogenase maturation protease
MSPDLNTGTCSLCIVGVGNTLAGDDGAGNIAVSRLMEKYEGRGEILFHNMETDPLELWDILPKCSRFIFLDAVAGRPPGRLVSVGKRSARRAYPPSLHHMDLPTVVRHLCSLRDLDDLQWSIWGVTIEIPERLTEELTPAVSRAVDDLVEILSERIESGELSVDAPGSFDRLDEVLHGL